MHQLYFVKFKKGQVAKEEALEEADRILEQNNFAGEGGYFSSCKADWYVTGGRWSGVLSNLLKKDKIAEAEAKMTLILVDEMKKHKDLMTYLSINPHLVDDTKRAELEKIYTEIVGVPYFRNNSHGLEDDVIELTPELLKAIKADKQLDEVEVACVEDGYIDCEITMADLKDNDLGDLLVTVDYHN